MSPENRLSALATMSPAQLRATWRETFRQPPPDITPELMARAIAWRLQERHHGGLPASVSRELAKAAERLRKTGEVTSTNEISLKPGTRLVRSWHGRTINVLVTEDGFEFEGRRYRSLTHVSSEVTGTHWSGPRFFGLKGKRKPKVRTSSAKGTKKTEASLLASPVDMGEMPEMPELLHG